MPAGEPCAEATSRPRRDFALTGRGVGKYKKMLQRNLHFIGSIYISYQEVEYWNYGRLRRRKHHSSPDTQSRRNSSTAKASRTSKASGKKQR